MLKAFTDLSNLAQMLCGDVPLNVNFVHSEPPFGATAVRINAFRKCDACTISIAVIKMQYEIYNNAH